VTEKGQSKVAFSKARFLKVYRDGAVPTSSLRIKARIFLKMGLLDVLGSSSLIARLSVVADLKACMYKLWGHVTNKRILH
jgi:hypothetical protein